MSVTWKIELFATVRNALLLLGLRAMIVFRVWQGHNQSHFVEHDFFWD
jgi:hypothetical protein